MKKFIIVLVSGVIYTSLITGYATAQNVTGLAFTASKIVYKIDSTGGENTSASLNEAVNKTSVKKMQANLKATKAKYKVTTHFNENFKNVSDISWYSSDELTIAHFNTDGKKVKVVYNKYGNWSYTIITYHEDQMPADIKSLIDDNYEGFSITLINEITQGDITCHMVYLESKKSFKHVLVYNGEIVNVETLKKRL